MRHMCVISYFHTPRGDDAPLVHLFPPGMHCCLHKSNKRAARYTGDFEASNHQLMNDSACESVPSHHDTVLG